MQQSCRESNVTNHTGFSPQALGTITHGSFGPFPAKAMYSYTLPLLTSSLEAAVWAGMACHTQSPRMLSGNLGKGNPLPPKTKKSSGPLHLRLPASILLHVRPDLVNAFQHSTQSHDLHTRAALPAVCPLQVNSCSFTDISLMLASPPPWINHMSHRHRCSCWSIPSRLTDLPCACSVPTCTARNYRLDLRRRQFRCQC